MGRRTVRDVMTTAVVSAYEAATFKDIAAMMTKRGFSALPVVGDGHRVIGVVSEADLHTRTEHEDRIRRGHRQGVRTPPTAGDLMSAPPITIGPDASIVEAARRMHRHGVKRLPVVAEHGYLVGIVSRHDLLRVFTRGDDEVQAEIQAEIGRLLETEEETVSVAVEKGVVTLTGHVVQQRLVPAVVRLAAATDGVVEVIDRLTVTAPA
jgi:CBS-domain-containing membrane protein